MLCAAGDALRAAEDAFCEAWDAFCAAGDALCAAESALRVRLRMCSQVGQATLRLIVHKLPDLRTKALSVGAQEEWVKPISQGGGGMF